MANLQQIREAVLGHQFSSAQYSTRINGWVNEALQKIYRKGNFRLNSLTEDFPTVASTSAYTLPSDFLKLASVFNADDNDPLVPVTLEEYDDLDDSSGKPYHYTVDGNDLVLYPTPDAAYNITLRYYNTSVELAADTDEPNLPEDYHYLLEHYALWRAYMAEHDFEAAEYHRGIFEKDLVEVVGELQSDTEKPPVQIEGGWFMGYP